MCGIAGYWGGHFASSVLRNMTDQIISRGPDSSGFWQDDLHQVGLAHRRLSVIDISDAGSQPIRSVCRNYVLVFNGEIYNHQDLRSELNSQYTSDWVGNSDTETSFKACSWGVELCKKLVGMFALLFGWKSAESFFSTRQNWRKTSVLWTKQQHISFWISTQGFKVHPTWLGQIRRFSCFFSLQLCSCSLEYLQ